MLKFHVHPRPDNDGLNSPRDTEPTGLEQPATTPTDPEQTATTPTDPEQAAATPTDSTPPAYDTTLFTPSVNEGQYELLVEVKPSVIPIHKVTVWLLYQ